MKQPIKLFLSLLVASFFLPGCMNKKQKTGQATVLTIGVMSSMDYLPLAVAQRNGYFEREGIMVNLRKFYSANERDAALQSGNLDGCILDYTGGAIQHAAGTAIFFTSQCDGTFELIAGKRANVASVNDLRGKNIATARHTVVDFCADMVLKQAKIAESEITKSEINKIPLRLEMLRNGKIDLTVLPDPFATIAKADGLHAVASLEGLGLHVTGIAFVQPAIDTKADAIHAFYRAYNNAIADLQQQPLSDFYPVLTEDIGFPPDLTNVAVLPAYHVARLPASDDLNAVNEWLKAKRLVPESYDIQTMIVRTFAPHE